MGRGGRKQTILKLTEIVERWSKMALNPEQYELVKQLRDLLNLLQVIDNWVGGSQYIGNSYEDLNEVLAKHAEEITKEVIKDLG